MALIGEIRKNSWLLIFMIGLGLGGFIIMDMFSGQQSVFGSNQTIMGDIDGQKVDWNNFSATEQMLYRSSGDVYGRRDQLWNYFVEETLVKNEAEELGLIVSKEELMDLQFGDDAQISPIIRQRFFDQTTGQLNRPLLDNYKQQIETNTLTDPNIRPYWAHQEKEIINERLKAKINAIVNKAVYTPTWMAEMAYNEQNRQVDFVFVPVPFDEIDNGEVALEDADYAAYLNENKKTYLQTEETRKLEYVVFDVNATAKDSAQWRKQIADLIPEFRNPVGGDSVFVERNYGTIDGAYVKKEAISADIADAVFSLPVGEVYGPYVENDAYRAVKVLARGVIPDSVKSRHILIKPNNSPLGLAQANKTVDSLKNLIQTGQASFDSLALKFGTDGTRTKGGDLGYVATGRMVKPFNDLIFYKAEENKLYKVNTQFGVHLVEVTGRKFINNEEGVSLAYITQSIVPTEDTQKDMYDEISEFVAANKTLDKLKAAVAERDDLEIETSPALKRNDFSLGALGSGDASRQLIRWAFASDSDVGDVSPEVYEYQDQAEYFVNKYVVAGLRSVQDPGMPSVANVKEDIEQFVINRKKAELIKSRVAGKEMNAIASEFSSQLDTARNVSFSAANVPGLGNEPMVVAKAFQMEVGQVSEPIAGKNGVYVIKVTKAPTDPAASPNIASLRKSTSSGMRSSVTTQLVQELRDNAEITDNRSRFY